MRNKSKKQSVVRCPFYRSDDDQKRKVVCEGLKDCSRISQEFARRKDYSMQVMVFCAENYRECSIYRMLMSTKYGKEDES